eukprot:GFUD01044166.1.p1 GENE.GFUD01044166.1~~GFUD01044166.1.p1  ORF type:complete len:517 (+),score=100.24 GFUD01044166.1:245-1795(+)
MTVTYIQYVPTAGKIGAFFRLLIIWKGGVVKGIWRDLVMYCVLYAAISVGYRYGLSQDEKLKLNFERVCVYFNRNRDYIPLSFILGFYVTQVVSRWWGQFTTLAWPDTLAMNLLSYLPGKGKPKRIRRLVIRWANLANILTLRRMSTEIARRFPTYDHLVEAGLLTESELKKLDKMIETTDALYPIYWVPLQWGQVEIRKAKDAGLISSDLVFSKLQESLQDLEVKNKSLLGYGWMNIPLVYTQLVTIAVHVYFLVTLLGRQYLTPTRYIGANGDFIKVPPQTPDTVNLAGHDDSALDFYIPFFTIMQFIFYFGWLKVAEILINPFGDDDDDFDVNYIIDRNFQTSYLMVDGSDGEETDEELEDDTYGNNIPPTTLPHTVESFKYKEPPPTMPMDNFIVNEDDLAPVECNIDSNLLFASNRKLSIKSCSLSWYNRRVSLKNEMCGRKEIQRRKQSLHLQRSASEVVGENSSGPMIVIDEATPLTPNMETIHSINSQKNFTFDPSDWEEDTENTKEE